MSEDFSVPTKRCAVLFLDGTSKTYRTHAIEPHDGFVVLHLIDRDKYGRPPITAIISAHSFSRIEIIESDEVPA